MTSHGVTQPKDETLSGRARRGNWQKARESLLSRTKFEGERIDRFLEAVRNGGTMVASAAHAGVSLDTVERRMVSDAVFADAVKTARTSREIGWLQTIIDAAKSGTWTAAAWLLERTNPEGYGRRQPDITVNVGAQVGDRPIVIQALLQVIADPKLTRAKRKIDLEKELERRDAAQQVPALPA